MRWSGDTDPLVVLLPARWENNYVTSQLHHNSKGVIQEQGVVRSVYEDL